MSLLYKSKLCSIATIEKQRSHFRFKVREVLKKLPENDFLPLIKTCLHSNHYPLLESYIEDGEKLHELTFNRININIDTCIYRKQVSDCKYLFKLHRKSLIELITSLTIDGYSPELVEYLIINNLWN